MIPAKKNVLFILLLLCLCFTQGIAQQVANVSVIQTLDSGRLHYTFYYDLLADQPNIASYVRVKIKTVSREFYITEATGALGEFVYPGTRKMIRWDYTRELVHFSGDIEYVVEAEPMIKPTPFVKRGKKLVVSLRTILPKDSLYTVTLYRKAIPIWHLADSIQGNSFAVTIPKKVKVRKGYQVAITHNEQHYFSSTFKIKRRVNRFLYVLAGGAIAVPFYLIATRPDEPLPEAPEVK